MFDSEVRIQQTSWNLSAIAVWLTCVVLGSVLPGWKHFIHTRGRFHLPLHFAVFAFSSLVTLGVAPSRGRRVLSCGALIGLAFVTEALQRAIYRINFEWRDFVTDTFGVLAALVFVVILQSRREPDFDRMA